MRVGRPPTPHALFVWRVGVLVLAGVYGIALLARGGRPLPYGLGQGVVAALSLSASAVAVARPVLIGRERAIWTAAAAGLVLYSVGSLWFGLAEHSAPGSGSAGLAEWLWLSCYAPLIVAVGLLARRHSRRGPAVVWLDGLVGALAVAALTIAVVGRPLLELLGEPRSSVLLELSFPIVDMVLLGALVGGLTVTGAHPRAVWARLVAALCLAGAADTIYVARVATADYVPGGLLDLTWPLALCLVADAAWRAPEPHRASRGRRSLATPLLYGNVAIALLVIDHWAGLGSLVVGLAAASLVLAMARTAGAFVANGRLADSEREALTDELTGLGNRRRLGRDLEQAARRARADNPITVALLDLDGFKGYNDAYGHAAGDALLTELAAALARAVIGDGEAYRLGGDEFCVLVDSVRTDHAVVLSRALDALHGNDGDVTIACSHGTATLPAETQDPREALARADARMYAQKDHRRASARRQARDLLVRILDEQQPDLQDHMGSVGRMAHAVGARLGLDPGELDHIAHAAELHDVGKVAVPEALLRKDGPLTREEWEVVHRHTVVGQRILEAVVALRPVARLVRSTHERFDGEGYPDGLRGEEIPLGARVIAVCDAFDAMTSGRPYRVPVEPLAALAELRAQAGTQFDPQVVDAFAEELEAPALVPAPAAPGAATTPAPGAAPEPSPAPVTTRMGDLLQGLARARRASDPETAAAEAAGAIGPALGFGLVAVSLHRPEWDHFRVAAVHGPPGAAEALVGREAPPAAWARVLDPRHERRGAYVVGADDDGGERIVVPLHDGADGALGVLWAEEPTRGRSPEDAVVDLLVAAAGQLGLALEELRDRAAATRQRRTLEGLLERSAQLAEARSPEAVARILGDGVQGALGLQAVCVDLVSELGVLEPAVALGGGPGWTREQLEPVALGVLEAVAPAGRGGAVLLAADARAAQRSRPARVRRRTTGPGAAAWRDHQLVARLEGSDGRLLGALWADEPEDRLLPAPAAMRALGTFVDQAARALDATGRLRAADERSDRDELTELGNRGAFVRQLGIECARVTRSERPFTLVLCDLDGFADVNRRVGRAAGDGLLRQVARVLDASVRRPDGAFRTGPDEFGLLLIEAGEQEAVDVVERIALELDHELPELGFTFGAAVCAQPAEDPQALLRTASMALWTAKRRKSRAPGES